MDLFKDKEFIEVFNQIEESSWLREYISQFPPEVLSNIIQIFGSKYHIKQRGESIVEVCPKDVSDELKTAEERLKMLMHESDADNITLLVAVIQIWDLLRTGHEATGLSEEGRCYKVRDRRDW